jgi:hypothetical protein
MVAAGRVRTVKRLARWLRTLADRIDHAEADHPGLRVDWKTLAASGRKPERKPEWSHPCPVCNAAGRVIPHRGQHPVIYAPEPKAPRS